MRYLIFCIISIMLHGCAGAPQQQEVADNPPAEYEATVKAYVKEKFFDPYSIRDATISEPVQASAVFDGVTPFPHRGWMVCLRANAKNRMGGYTGLQMSGLLFKGNTIDTVISEPTHAVAHHCKGAAFRDFEIS